MDLIQLQQSTRKITNPLNVDFIIHWDSKPYKIPAKTTWSLIGPLADHAARHLEMKIYYAYHDEQVAKIKQTPNGIQAARKYRVPANVEDAIFFMINGFHKPQYDEQAKAEAEAVDLSFIAQAISDVDSHAEATGGDYKSISELVDAATNQTYNQIQAADLSDAKPTAHANGSTNTVRNIAKILQQGKDPVTQAIEANKLATELDRQAQAPVPSEVTTAQTQPEPKAPEAPVNNPTNGEFGDLASLS